ncbi:hypothetical protein [Streptomyces sp. NBC_01012]|uniref:hypothetical protein n=1 Tax=Streptomyces sp. NBC_01012 TaxID=2903717 RepID=UPI003868BCE1|nr:hypothetical protein OG623_15545 [Streptomyces sp. NBC_01012]
MSEQWPTGPTGARLVWVRSCLALLAVGEGLPAAWALLWPRHFYDTYPLPGHPWVAGFPPYNEHLTRDFGAAVLALTVVLGWAACTARRGLVRAAAVSALTFCVPHLIFHSAHLGHPFGLEEAFQLVSLSVPVAAAVVALLAAGGTTALTATPPGHGPVRSPAQEETPG